MAATVQSGNTDGEQSGEQELDGTKYGKQIDSGRWDDEFVEGSDETDTVSELRSQRIDIGYETENEDLIYRVVVPHTERNGPVALEVKKMEREKGSQATYQDAGDVEWSETPTLVKMRVAEVVPSVESRDELVPGF